MLQNNFYNSPILNEKKSARVLLGIWAKIVTLPPPHMEHNRMKFDHTHHLGQSQQTKKEKTFAQ